jgi:translocation and assembly module TamA
MLGRRSLIDRGRVARPAFVTLVSLVLTIAASPARAEVPYETKLVGTDDRQLLSELKAVSQLVTLQDKPPQSDEALRRRAREDLPRLKPVLESRGYWEGTVDFSIDLDAKPAEVTLKVDTGPVYRLKEVSLVTPERREVPDLAGLDPSVFGLKLGDPAKSALVLDAEGKIAGEYAHRGRPFAKVTAHKAVVDRGTKTMSVTYTVDPGPRARFGPTTIAGLKSLGQDYVDRRIAWHEGETYDDRTVESTRKPLLDSGLFSTLRIDHAAQLDPTGAVPMTVTLVERAPRSIGGGLSYNTSEGFGANALWEHRNLFGEGERLRLDADVAEQRRDIIANFRKPDFLGDRDQDLTALAEFVDENPIAYTARRGLVSPRLERRFAGVYTAGVGVQVQHATVTEAARDITQTYSLASLPLFLRRDTSDDPLNPQQGSRLSLLVTPNTSFTGESLTFLNSRADASVYRRVGESDRYVAAAFLGVGSIVGESRDDLPADQRFYAGGGGSLRGYGYQLAGPLGPGNKPLGGTSLLQFGTELRIKITESIGVVPFIEAGNVYTTPFPKLGGQLFYDTGIGLRYYTPIGPVRFDIATPLRRRSVDSAVQVYISIGQAF